MTAGDPDGDGVADEYPGDTGTDETVESMHLATLNTNDNDPAIVTVPMPLTTKSGYLYVKNNDGTNAMTVSAVITEKLS